MTSQWPALDRAVRWRPGCHFEHQNELEHKKGYYPTRRGEEAVNPDGTALRSGPDCG